MLVPQTGAQGSTKTTTTTTTTTTPQYVLVYPFRDPDRTACIQSRHAWPQSYDHIQRHTPLYNDPCNTGSEHVGFSRKRQTKTTFFLFIIFVRSEIPPNWFVVWCSVGPGRECGVVLLFMLCSLVVPHTGGTCWWSILVVHIGTTCSTGAAYWRRILVLHTGAAYWCRILVPHTGITYWCDILVPNTGATYRCHLLVPPTDATYWCRILVPPTDAIYWCDGQATHRYNRRAAHLIADVKI